MLKTPRLKSLLLAGTFLLHPVSYSHAVTSVCAPGITVPVGGSRNGIEIDKAWSGATVIFDAVARNGKTYVGYYDADRWLTVAQLDHASGIVCRTRLPSRFAGWDSHNIVSLAFDGNGKLQVAGNMHSSPLIYGSAAAPDSVADITLSPMTGQDEEKATYPSFIKGPSGALYFVYRNGMSGDGGWFVNIRDGEKWKRAINTPIFSSFWAGSTTNAYPTPFRIYQDGFIHIAAVWRRTPDVASNYAITYARTRDFIHWEDHNGQPITPPMNPGNSDVIDAPGEGKGLVNLARVGVTANGKPVIAYTKYGPQGRNSIILATPSTNGWSHSIISTAEQLATVSGGGTIPDLPFIGDPDVSGGSLGVIDIGFPHEKRKRIFFKTDTLEITDIPQSKAKPAIGRPITISPPIGLVDARRNLRSVRVDGAADKPAGLIVHFSQGINRDQARKCTTAQPTACNPSPSPLIFVQ
ncbi:BNR repeat-containing protein [Agrobacterium tumefaciens]|uniref:BNR repeat-containing protein n=1 Tax=Agrobacterium tumefaciens TaxID=358 RepID=UPI00157475A5|nr:BNR repeat-containing protein [Agrobacterium tumefaciens]NTA45147.1 hypothetical protein [Agrobacterium tumefaciens]WIE33974.1 BNR repeat-containing protein [Agrobacterium tumefaciens]